MINVSLFIEEDTLVTLTGTEDITSERMSDNLSISTRYTNSATCHLDGSRAFYIRCLTTTIDICQDMTATDSHLGITLNGSCRTQIFTDARSCIEVRNTTRTTTKHITIISMTIGSLQSATFSRCSIAILIQVTRCISIRIVWCEWCFEWPAGALKVFCWCIVISPYRISKWL